MIFAVALQAVSTKNHGTDLILLSNCDDFPSAAEMFSSWETRSIKQSLPILNDISITDFEALGNIVISRMNGESTPSTEKHFGRCEVQSLN